MTTGLGVPAPEPYYITCDQARMIAELDEDVAVRGFGDHVAGEIEVLLFLSSKRATWDYETLIVDPGGTVLSRVTIEEGPDEITGKGRDQL